MTRLLRLLAPVLAIVLFANFSQPDAWGFFAHRRINRLAVLTLPPAMMVFFKPNIDWISDHAVDPDMRRYATKNEAPRHYLDLDRYGSYPFENLPRDFTDALMGYTEVYTVSPGNDTVLVYGPSGTPAPEGYRRWFADNVLPAFYRAEESLVTDSAVTLFTLLGKPAPGKLRTLFYREHLSEHGIVPWHLERMQRSLTEAFRNRDRQRILKLSADFGHYIGDAHVPLHTCSNYNGQQTGQDGIHGFWESRIPELFADEQYDFLVGKPDYIDNPREFYWKIVLESHLLVDSVLAIEKQLRGTFPADRQICPELRGRSMMMVQCAEFAAAYQDAMDGMVERRFRSAIQVTASAWMTAWIDAGQPDLRELGKYTPTKTEQEEEDALRKALEGGKIIGRQEDH